ncbi:MAG: 3-hydroxyacyl-CoA dehydrogenase family protein [Leucobacter sp.]
MSTLPEPVAQRSDGLEARARALDLPGWARSVAVVGAGLMGQQIVARMLERGFAVSAVEPSPEQLERARARLAGSHPRAELAWHASLGELEGGDFDGWVLEAVPERLELKLQVLAEAERRLSPRLIASNTSSLSIGTLQSGLRDPARMLGMHFFQPIEQTLLIELISGGQTGAEAAGIAEGIALELGLYPLLAVDRPGFATSRLALALGLEAIRALEEGVAGVADIDEGMLRGYGHRHGPLKMTDIVGLDTRLNIARFLESELGERFRPPQLLVDMVEAGRLGRKAGVGFYDWPDGAA